jgi:hypothetical protein
LEEVVETEGESMKRAEKEGKETKPGKEAHASPLGEACLSEKKGY